MPSPSESRAALRLVTGAAVTVVTQLVPEQPENAADARLALVEAVPGLVGYYADGSAALAADFYDDEREIAAPRRRFSAEPVVADREEKIRRAVVWATGPWFGEDTESTVTDRLSEVVQLETARPYRDTITTNSRRDPSSVGWRRVASGGCKFCSMLAGRGAVYKQETAHFASHKHCHCTAQPVFDGQGGEEASTIQYLASKRRRSEADRKRLRDYLASMPD